MRMKAETATQVLASVGNVIAAGLVLAGYWPWGVALYFVCSIPDDLVFTWLLRKSERAHAYELVENELRDHDVCEVIPWRSPFWLGGGAPADTSVKIRGKADPFSAVGLMAAVDAIGGEAP